MDRFEHTEWYNSLNEADLKIEQQKLDKKLIELIKESQEIAKRIKEIKSGNPTKGV